MPVYNIQSHFPKYICCLFCFWLFFRHNVHQLAGILKETEQNKQLFIITFHV